MVGSGHNGLVAAANLAASGKKVLVLERRHVVGTFPKSIVHFSLACAIRSLL